MPILQLLMIQSSCGAFIPFAVNIVSLGSSVLPIFTEIMDSDNRNFYSEILPLLENIQHFNDGLIVEKTKLREGRLLNAYLAGICTVLFLIAIFLLASYAGIVFVQKRRRNAGKKSSQDVIATISASLSV